MGSDTNNNNVILHGRWRIFAALLSSLEALNSLVRGPWPAAAGIERDYSELLLYNQIKRVAKQTYYAQQLAKYQHDIRQTWKIINNAMGKTNNKSDISQTFKDNNSNISDPHTIANKFCEYFTNIGLTYRRCRGNTTYVTDFAKFTFSHFIYTYI